MAINDFRARVFPYCLKKQDDGRFVALNRSYKPVGFMTDEHVDYQSYPIQMTLGISDALRQKLAVQDSVTDEETIYLYNDATNPSASKANMDAYLKKLALLSKLKTEK